MPFHPFKAFVSFQPVSEFFRLFLGLPLVYADLESLQMVEILPSERPQSILNFEVNLKRSAQRNAYDIHRLKRASRFRRPLRSSFNGLHDLTIPVSHSNRPVGALLIGPYRRLIPNQKRLQQLYLKYTGGKAFPGDPEFIQFASTYLDAPKIGDSAEAALISLLQSALKGLAEGEDATASMEAALATLALELPYRSWMPSAMGVDRFQTPVRWEKPGSLSSWENRAMGFKSLPNCAFAVYPKFKIETISDPVESLLANARISEALFNICRRRRNLAAGPYAGTLAIAASLSEKETTSGRGGLARSLEKELRRRTGIRAIISQGPMIPPGAPLILSFETALKNAYRDAAEHQLGNPDASTVDFLRSLQSLQDATSSLRNETLSVHREAFIRLAIRVSLSLADLRHWLLVALGNCLFTLSNPQDLDLESQLSQWNAALLRCGSAPELAAKFRVLLAQVMTYLAKPRQFSNQDKIKMAKDMVDTHWQHPPNLKRLAPSYGLSTSVFSREFQSLVGIGYRDYINRRKIREAEKLLREGRMTITQISKYCGFSFLSHFSRTFHSAHNSYPSEWVKSKAT